MASWKEGSWTDRPHRSMQGPERLLLSKVGANRPHSGENKPMMQLYSEPRTPVLSHVVVLSGAPPGSHNAASLPGPWG